MRAKLLGVALAALTFSTAFAGEMPRTGSIVAKAQADDKAIQWNRTGLYVGLIGAYDVSVLEVDGIDFGSGKLMAGAVAGFNWRLPNTNFVLGIEGDWIFTGVSASSSTEEVSLKASTDHLLTLRARAGVALGPALLYLTGGPAWKNAKFTDLVEDATDRTWQLGWAFGGGAEVELTRAFAVRIEALHYVFPEDGAPLSFLDSEDQRTAVRAGFVFKLN
jgi:outer membrane immunogenic protein